ncbi:MULTISPECIES: DUF58 domain-containing protein [Halorussus]|uniref:DUF58 domain-containing protein n=1 Tax=Halorussus TaxID=1070314 RepID=UPI00209DA6A1|nr:DUF58 domain-containing protein [Halorussus vallis]USZ77074.1 DUF58 domain-containing protein [Halorussus vallis]
MTTTRTTDRWRAVVALALFAGVVGIVAKRPLALLSAVVAVAFAVYPRVSPTPAVSLDIERAVEERARSGETVGVTVTLRNTGDRTLPDVRIVDGVPPMLTVAEGSARHAAVLRPGATTTFSYEVEAVAGRHQFDPATVIARDWSGATEVETTVGTETEIDCTADVPEVPLRQQTDARVGPLATDSGGSGVEFYRTRGYQRGDPMSRIDWNRLARTGELTTVDFREERAASVVVCIDARRPAYRAREDEPHAVAYGKAAAESLVTALLGTRQRVGIAAIGREFCWLAPGAGTEHAARARETLATHPTLSAVPPEEHEAAETAGGASADGDAWDPGRSGVAPVDPTEDGEGAADDADTAEDAAAERKAKAVADGGRSRAGAESGSDSGFRSGGSERDDAGRDRDQSPVESQVTELKKRLAADTQLLFVTPLADEFPVETALELEARGTSVSVVSPDVTADETPGDKLARVERENRVHALRRSSVPVVDWDPDDRLGAAIAASLRRRSA